jgi:hypothetical protein
MKGIKIQVVKKEIDCHYPVFKEAIASQSKTIFNEGEKANYEMTLFKEKKYKLRRVFNGFDKEPINYFVEESDYNIFNDLMTISKDDIERHFHKGENLGKLRQLEETRSILKLPWYKRLFNKKIIEEIDKTILGLSVEQA